MTPQQKTQINRALSRHVPVHTSDKNAIQIALKHVHIGFDSGDEQFKREVVREIVTSYHRVRYEHKRLWRKQ